MTSGEFGLSRDMLYLSGLLAGIALGFFLSAFKKNSSTRFRSRRIALTLLFLSLMIASLAVSVIASMGAIFAERGVLVCAGLAVLVFAVAVRFPRAVAYPLIIFGGLVTVWLTWSYLRFPQFHDTPVALVSSAANDSFAVRIFSGSDGENTSAAVSGESGLREKNDSGRIFYTNSGVSVLDFFLVFIELDQIFPVAGGRKSTRTPIHCFKKIRWKDCSQTITAGSNHAPAPHCWELPAAALAEQCIRRECPRKPLYPCSLRN